ncbi:MAG: tetratricopeptide repeat protein [Candidatus Sumerlaeaceae bacterium]|nr:tetratricopeptide repeat protein [Candidatus Sumerlaeaceae bacterium]
MRFTYAAAFIIAFTLLLTPGCSKRTPEDRMRKAVQLAQQRDTLGAMLEAKDLIKKHPDDPMALQARMLLAQIAASDRRVDDALAEYKAVLDTVSQKDPLGVAALRGTIALLRQSKRTDEALKTIDEYQKRYADDEGVSLSLTVARAEVLATDGKTTDARTILLGLRDTTTQPEILRFYRSMIASTYMQDKAFADALAFFTAELQRADNDADKRTLMLQIAGTHAAMENYDEARKILDEATRQYDSAIRRELDAQERLALASELVNAYSGIGNLPGVRAVVEGLIAQTDDARLAAELANELTRQMVLREGKTSEALTLLRDLDKRFPNGPFLQMATQLETMSASGELDRQISVDTSPVVQRFVADPILAPAVFLDKNTTGLLSTAKPPVPEAQEMLKPAAAQPQPSAPETTAP